MENSAEPEWVIATEIVEDSLLIQPLDPEVAVFVQTLTFNAREYFAERAAIAEFDAGLSRFAAEQFALEQTLARFGLQK